MFSNFNKNKGLSSLDPKYKLLNKIRGGLADIGEDFDLDLEIGGD